MTRFTELLAGVSGETVATPVAYEAPVLLETLSGPDTAPASVEEPVESTTS